MLARITSAAVLGIDAYLVDVETDIAGGLPSFVTVGLPQGAVKEGRERVNAAIHNAGYEFPLKRITVNLAPAYRSKARLHLTGESAAGPARACAARGQTRGP